MEAPCGNQQLRDEIHGIVDRAVRRGLSRRKAEPIIEKARMLKNHLHNILTYLVHGITNAMSESMNSKIQWVKYAARGFRNVDNFKNAIYFRCGDLDLAPRPT